jgi:iron complex transport system ATP-binding protein
LSIKVKNLTFGYGKQPILKQVSFTASSHQLLSILGANGVGKSTLFRCILGLENNYTGEITVLGQDLRRMTIKDIAKAVAYIPQSHYPAFNYPVFDMVLMGTTNQVSLIASPGKNQVKLAEIALEKLGIGHLKNRGYTQISGGERQLVLMARALVQNSRILILDEPTANLDYGNQIRVLSQLKALAKEGYTIIQSTHNPDQTFLFSDMVIAMKNGQIIAQGNPGEIFTEELIQLLYTTDVNISSLYQDRVRVCIPRSAL